jgi:hypothetical protein
MTAGFLAAARWGASPGESGEMRHHVIPIALCALALTACAGSSGSSKPGGFISAVKPALYSIDLSPSKITIHGKGDASKVIVNVTERNYSGLITVVGCKNNAAHKPASGRGPTFKLAVTGLHPGTCSLTLEDSLGDVVGLPVRVKAQ